MIPNAVSHVSDRNVSLISKIVHNTKRATADVFMLI